MKDIVYNTNKSKNNNKIDYYNNVTENNNNSKIISINAYNIKPFQKIKKINFDSLDAKLHEHNLNINNAIKNENMHRQNYIMSKIGMNKEKKVNKSINIVHNQHNGNGKFKKYMNQLLDKDYSFNNEHIKNKTMNLTPILQHMNINHFLKNKNEKNESAKNKINNNNKNQLFPIKFDYNLIKKNKITNLFEYYRTNGLKQYMQRNTNIINNLNKKSNNAGNRYINNNVNLNLKNKFDLEEKLSDYMKKRCKNYAQKTNNNISNNKNNKKNNFYKLYLNSRNNNNINNNYMTNNSISPNSITNKQKNKLYINKSYIKNNNTKILFNKVSKNSNNNSKNNSVNKNVKKNTNNFLLQTNFNNILKKNISNKNKNIKNRNNLNLTTYNSLMNNNELKNIYKLNFHKINQNNGYKTTYHSRDKSKKDIDFTQYTQISENNNKNNLNNHNNIMNTNIFDFNILNDNSTLIKNFSPYYLDDKKYKNNDYGINNINII